MEAQTYDKQSPQELFKTLIRATGLPSEIIEEELFSLLQKENLSSNDLNMNDLRKILAKYLQNVLTHAKEHYEDESKSAL